MAPIKVALCYRGQMRMIDQADQMRHRVMESLSDYDIDIRFFGHTITTETPVYTQVSPDLKKHSLRETNIVKNELVLEQIKQMGIHKFRIFEHGMNYQTAARIIDYWTTQPGFVNFLRQYPPRFHFMNYFTIENYPRDIHFLGKNAAQKEQYFRNQLFIGDFISQYVSAGHSIQMARDYYEEYDWKPDIIVSLRWDAAFEFKDFVGLLGSLEHGDNVFCRGLVVRDGMALMDDLAFVTDYDTAMDWLGDIDHRILELLTDWRVLSATSEFNIRSVPHTFWNFLARHGVQYANSDLFAAALMRPGVQNELDVSTASVKEIDQYCKTWNDNLNKQIELEPERPASFEYVKKMLGLDEDFTL